MSGSADQGWTGIVEVLVATLNGSVRWEPDSVELQLPGSTSASREEDLDGLRLCLGRIGVPVVFDPSPVNVPDAPLVEFLKKLVTSGLMVDVQRSAIA